MGCGMEWPSLMELSCSSGLLSECHQNLNEYRWGEFTIASPHYLLTFNVELLASGFLFFGLGNFYGELHPVVKRG
jgi:hypothetical protein